MSHHARIKEWTSHIRQTANLPARMILWNGDSYELGRHAEPTVTFYINDIATIPSLMRARLDGIGEAYINGKIDIVGKIHDVIQVTHCLARFLAKTSMLDMWKARIADLWSGHSKEFDHKAIQFHYDVSNEFYKLWLDSNMIYSCAYFENGDETLEQAQLKKLDHIFKKLQLQRGQTLLDIGCGWGGLLIRAAQLYGVKGTGITLSQEQCTLARERVKAAKLQHLIEIRLADYRDIEGKFDRIASVGMFEHVGAKNMDKYFSCIRNLLSDNGIALNHGIAAVKGIKQHESSGGTSFIEKYVFPGGELPCIGKVMQAMQDCDLEVVDVESLRRHYVKTLDDWGNNLEDNAVDIRNAVGENRFRIWRVYLAGFAHAFDTGDVSIYQVVCYKTGQSAATLPWSRRFMYGKVSDVPAPELVS